MRGLQRRGQQVVPLKYRRETPLKPIPVEALCDFESDQVSHYLTLGSLDLQHRSLGGGTGRAGATSSHLWWVSLSVLSFSWGWICTPIPFPPPLPCLHLSYQLNQPSHSSYSPREASRWPMYNVYSHFYPVVRPQSYGHPEAGI